MQECLGSTAKSRSVKIVWFCYYSDAECLCQNQRVEYDFHGFFTHIHSQSVSFERRVSDSHSLQNGIQAFEGWKKPTRITSLWEIGGIF